MVNMETKETKLHNPLKYTPYSFSKINYWKGCPRKFRYQYVDKIPVVKADNIHLQRGRLVHLIFELKRDIQKIKVHKEFLELKDKMEPEVIKECFGIYDKFISSDLGKSLMKRTDAFAELPIGLDENLNHKGYSDKDVLLRGYIDKGLVDEKSDTLILLDWKTGKYKEKADQDWAQLLYYSIALFSKMPFDNIVIGYVYVEHNKMNSRIVKRDHIDRYKTALYQSINKIEADKTFTKNVSGLCSFCDFEALCRDGDDVPWDE